MSDEKQILEAFKATKEASYKLQSLSAAQIKMVLHDFSRRLLDETSRILEANRRDLAKMEPENPLYDRLLLNEERLQAIAADVVKVSELESPVGEVLETRELPNGTFLSRHRVPLGVVGAIYEARPNVTMDIFSLCFRTQNACVLRGGTDAHETNMVTAGIIQDCLNAHDLPREAVYLMPPERSFMPLMLQAYGLIDVCIPRGSQALIDYVRETAVIPVIETGRGVVHIYFDETGDRDKGKAIIQNAKTRRPSVCNSLDTLLIHKSRLDDLPVLVGDMAAKNVHIYADDLSKSALENEYPANLIGTMTTETLDTEFLGLKMNICAVENPDQALLHIRQYGSGHTDAVICEDDAVAQKFVAGVDSAVVMVNASTAFSDGGEFGLGAEIGISTQKLHARGPMGLAPLTSYKWVLSGNGQIRAA